MLDVTCWAEPEKRCEITEMVMEKGIPTDFSGPQHFLNTSRFVALGWMSILLKKNAYFCSEFVFFPQTAVHKGDV